MFFVKSYPNTIQSIELMEKNVTKNFTSHSGKVGKKEIRIVANRFFYAFMLIIIIIK